MNEAALDTALILLGQFLAEIGSAPIWLVVGGGSALLAQHLSIRQTKDVDVMALREWEGNVISAYPLPAAVKQAAAWVAIECQLDAHWLNSSAAKHGFDFSLLPTHFWQDLTTRAYGERLKVSFIGRSGLILFKLSAAMDRDQERDMEDLRCLQPNRQETFDSLQWLLRHLYERNSHPKIPILLQHIGHADLIPEFL